MGELGSAPKDTFVTLNLYVVLVALLLTLPPTRIQLPPPHCPQSHVSYSPTESSLAEQPSPPPPTLTALS